MPIGTFEDALGKAKEAAPDVSISFEDAELIFDIVAKASALVQALNAKGHRPTEAKRELQRALERFYD